VKRHEVNLTFETWHEENIRLTIKPSDTRVSHDHRGVLLLLYGGKASEKEARVWRNYVSDFSWICLE